MIPIFLSTLACGAHRMMRPLVLFILCIFMTSACGQKGVFDTHHTPDSGVVSFPDDLPPDTTLSAGTMRGGFSVSSTGEAIYTLPLVIPPGRAGMQPSLALTYDSATGDGGAVGKGFSISGLSAVTRCAHTAADNGFLRGVRFDAEDALCLDGKRLVKFKSSPGVDEFRTVPDTFRRVLAYYPSPGGAVALGPEHFEVHTKAGLTLLYGDSPDSRAMANNGAVRTWWISRSTDRNQNSILYSYEN